MEMNNTHTEFNSIYPLKVLENTGLLSVFFYLILSALFPVVLNGQLQKIRVERVGPNQQLYTYEGMTNERGEIIIPAVYDYIWDFGLDTITLARRQVVSNPSESTFKYELVTSGGYQYLEFPENLLPSPPSEKIYRIFDTQKELYAYWDFKGKEITRFRYSDALDFTEGLAAVLDPYKGYWGYINTKGDFEIRATFDAAFPFSEGYSVVYDTDRFYYCDKKGLLNPIREQYSMIYPVKEGKSVVLRDSLYGIVDTNGLEILKPQYRFIDNFLNGRAVFMKDNKVGMLDAKGNVVIENRYEEIYRFDQEHYLIVLNGMMGLINLNGETTIPARYSEIGFFSEGLAPVKLAGKWGFVDHKGAEIIPCSFEKIESGFKDGKAIVRPADQWYLVHKSDTLILPSYEEILPFYGYSAAVRKNNLWGFINALGEETIEPQFTELIFSKGGLCFGGKINSKGMLRYALINVYGKQATDAKYSDIVRFTEGFAAVKDSLGWGFIDGNGIEISRPQYDEVRNFSAGRAAVRKNKQWAFINTKGIEAISMFQNFPDLSETLVQPASAKDSINAIREVFPLYLIEVVGDFEGSWASVEDLTLANDGSAALCMNKTGKINTQAECNPFQRYADAFIPDLEENKSISVLKLPGSTYKIDIQGKRID
jgi:hypothetical protein